MTTDSLHLALSGADQASLARFEAALADLQCYRNDPVAGADAALALSPDFTMAHVLRAWLHLLGTEPAGLPVARESLAAAAALPCNTREQGHIAALGHLIASIPRRGGRAAAASGGTPKATS